MNKSSIILIGCLLFSCIGQHRSDSQKAEFLDQKLTSAEKTGDTLKIDLLKSKIFWKGTKMRGAGMHSGEVGLENGYFILENDTIIGGEFIVDMNKLSVTDIPLSDPVPLRNLTTHLKSSDFFDVEKHPYSKFEILTVRTISNDSLIISGNLTMKDISRTLQFTALSNSNSFTTAFNIDRFQWNISYKGSLADWTFVDKEIELRVELIW